MCNNNRIHALLSSLLVSSTRKMLAVEKIYFIWAQSDMKLVLFVALWAWNFMHLGFSRLKWSTGKSLINFTCFNSILSLTVMMWCPCACYQIDFCSFWPCRWRTSELLSQWLESSWSVVQPSKMDIKLFLLYMSRVYISLIDFWPTSTFDIWQLWLSKIL